MWRNRKKKKNGNQNSVAIWECRVSFRDKISNYEQTGRTKCLCQVNLGTKTVRIEEAIEGDIITRETKEDISSKEIITINTNDEALALAKEVPHNNSIQGIKPGKGGIISIGRKDTNNNKAGKEKEIIKEDRSDSLLTNLQTKGDLKEWIARNRVGLDRDKAIKYHRGNRGKEIEGNIHRLHHWPNKKGRTGKENLWSGKYKINKKRGRFCKEGRKNLFLQMSEIILYLITHSNAKWDSLMRLRT